MMKNDHRVKIVARTLAKAFSNGGDPEAPAIRWSGSVMEPQEFPLWHDYLPEAVLIVSALDTAEQEGK